MFTRGRTEARAARSGATVHVLIQQSRHATPRRRQSSKNKKGPFLFFIQLMEKGMAEKGGTRSAPPLHTGGDNASDRGWRRLFAAVKYSLNNLGGGTGPQMLVFMIPHRPFSPCARSLITTETWASWNDKPASDENVISPHCRRAELQYSASGSNKWSVPTEDEVSGWWSQATGAVATETENQDLGSRHRNVTAVPAFHTHSRTRTARGSEVVFCMCEIEIKRITNNNTTSKQNSKLYTHCMSSLKWRSQLEF